MKKILFLMLVFVSLSAHAQYRLGEPRIEEIVKNVSANNPKDFWMTLYNNHPHNIRIDKAIHKQKKSMVQVLNTLPDMTGYREYVAARAINSNEARNLIDTLNAITKIESTFPNVKFFVIEKKSPNASMSIDGTGIINSYWLEAGTNFDELVAICCHEAAHFVLSHIIRDKWNTVKAAKTNAVLAEVGTGLAMATYAAGQIYAASNGVAQSSEAQQQMYSNIAVAGINAYYDGILYAETRQSHKYSRDSETEADEVAFWFMEKNGIDPIHLINMFKRMESMQPEMTRAEGKISDHPSMKKRVSHLESLYRDFHKNK